MGPRPKGEEHEAMPFDAAKVEAHRTDAPAWSSAKILHIRGNACADRRAKAAGLRRRVPEEHFTALTTAYDEYVQ